MPIGFDTWFKDLLDRERFEVENVASYLNSSPSAWLATDNVFGVYLIQFLSQARILVLYCEVVNMIS